MSKNEKIKEKLEILLSKFELKEQKILKEFFEEEVLKNLYDEKPIYKNKIDLFYLLKSYNENAFDTNKEKFMRHKAIQTRALILDLISTDYSADVKFIYRPEKWIYKITDDIKLCFNDHDELVFLYNKFLIQEFEDIFLSKVEKYGSSGNQLLVNFEYYKRFMSNILKYDFTKFLLNIKKQINPDKLYDNSEIDKIVNETS